jgi:predicted Zn-ribbon and HTH transcriptional regulator
MSADMLIFLYVALLMGGLCWLAIYTDVRRARFRPSRAEDRVFRCTKCSFVYTDDPDVDNSRCPQCSTLNEAIKF